ncbi:MAG: trypsin-like peptidase domain-containing protein [Nakamurella sp.]
MSQDLTPPRPGDLPAPSPRFDNNETGRAQNATPSYSAPSPADRPTSTPPGHPAPGTPPAGQAWGDMSKDTGPVPTQPAGDQAAWQSRPSGAWATPSWAAPSRPSAAPGNTQSFPSGSPTGGYYPAGGYGTGGYSSAGHPVSTATRTPPPPAAPAKGHRTSLIVATTAVFALLAGFGGGLVGAELNASSPASADSSLTQLGTSAPVADRTAAPAGSVQEVAAKVLPSTVSVLASSQQSSGEGSGVILTDDGLILTNNHVVAGATTLEVRFNDGTTASAEVVGSTATDDLAVIKADGVSGLTPASLGSSADLQVGQPVVAIGSPLGLSATVTSGIVSALNRPVRTAAEEQGSSAQDTVINAVQTDAAINPGNSGGALVDMSGNVIGINSAIASLSASSDGSQAGSIGVGFAIPVDQAKRIAQEIIDTGKATHAVLGASVGDAASDSSQISTGAQIAQITQGSGAEAAGLKDGDVITGLGNQSVESADSLIAAVRSSAPNSTTKVTYIRDGQTETVDVTLGSADAN